MVPYFTWALYTGWLWDRAFLHMGPIYGLQYEAITLHGMHVWLRQSLAGSGSRREDDI